MTQPDIELPTEFVQSAERLVKLANQALERVLANPKAPASAVVSAANSVLDRQERAKERAERSAAEKELQELTPGELAAVIHRLVLQRAATNAQDAQVIEVSRSFPQ